MKKYGCIGKNLTHSFSKEIHAKLADYNYELIELSEDEKNRLVSKLEKTSGKNVNAEFVVDQSILGGIIVETDGKILDGSLKYKLKDVKEGMSR